MIREMRYRISSIKLCAHWFTHTHIHTHICSFYTAISLYLHLSISFTSVAIQHYRFHQIFPTFAKIVYIFNVCINRKKKCCKQKRMYIHILYVLVYAVNICTHAQIRQTFSSNQFIKTQTNEEKRQTQIYVNHISFVDVFCSSYCTFGWCCAILVGKINSLKSTSKHIHLLVKIVQIENTYSSKLKEKTLAVCFTASNTHAPFHMKQLLFLSRISYEYSFVGLAHAPNI